MTESIGGFELGRVHCVDALEAMRRLPDGCVDFVFTDPPYGHNNNNNDLAHNREKALGLVKRGACEAGEARPIANDGAEATPLVDSAMVEINRLLSPGCCCCCCGGGGGPDPQFARWSMILDERIGFKHAVVWDKGGLGMGWHYRRNYELVLVAEKPGAPCRWFGGHSVGNVIRISGIKPSAEEHPTPKPVELVERFLSFHTRPGDLVVDPFSGGGSTAAACVRTGRRFLGFELDPRWVELSNRRVAAEHERLGEVRPADATTGQQAGLFAGMEAKP